MPIEPEQSPLSTISTQIALTLTALSAPPRVAILLAIGSGEACVCHLEVALGWRQAYISQHLMALRKAGILQDARRGRFIYYSLKNPAYLDLLKKAALLGGLSVQDVSALINTRVYPACQCPHCLPSPILLDGLQP